MQFNLFERLVFLLKDLRAEDKNWLLSVIPRLCGCIKNLVIGKGGTWFVYSKQRLLTQHIRESLQVWPVSRFIGQGLGMGLAMWPEYKTPHSVLCIAFTYEWSHGVTVCVHHILGTIVSHNSLCFWSSMQPKDFQIWDWNLCSTIWPNTPMEPIWSKILVKPMCIGTYIALLLREFGQRFL